MGVGFVLKFVARNYATNNRWTTSLRVVESSTHREDAQMTRLARRQKSRWVRLWKRRGYRYWGGVMVQERDWLLAMGHYGARISASGYVLSCVEATGWLYRTSVRKMRART
jgi:hypothetical protein